MTLRKQAKWKQNLEKLSHREIASDVKELLMLLWGLWDHLESRCSECGPQTAKLGSSFSRPGMLQSVRLQRLGHNLAPEQQQ